MQFQIQDEKSKKEGKTFLHQKLKSSSGLHVKLATWGLDAARFVGVNFIYIYNQLFRMHFETLFVRNV